MIAAFLSAPLADAVRLSQSHLAARDVPPQVQLVAAEPTSEHSDSESVLSGDSEVMLG